jgi:DNA ligase-1
MKEFAALYTKLDSSTKTNTKVEFLAEFFRNVPPDDAIWAVAVLSGRRPKRAVPSTKLELWAAELAGIPAWLFSECYDAVGDLAETVSLVLPDSGNPSTQGLAWWVQHEVIELNALSEDQQKERVTTSWRKLGTVERFLFNKLITGGFRVGVSQELVVRGLSKAFDVPSATLAHRMMGNWPVTAAFFRQLISAETDLAEDLSRPYPFCLAHPVEGAVQELGLPSEWLAEWKWDGIRCQLINRNGQSFLWSRGEELITDRFPELREIAAFLPSGTVIDGEIVAWKGGILPFAELQKRIGRKSVSARLREEVPVHLIAFDLLELQGSDTRDWPLAQRRANLLQFYGTHPNLQIAKEHAFSAWEDLVQVREAARASGTEGLMLKRRSSRYHAGRKRGDWWKWKVSPMTIDAVIVYAQRGSGRRASIYSDYTFAVWDDTGSLVPFAKAYSGLSDDEMRQVDAIVRKTTKERFGPVRTVEPTLVMELAFEGIQRSSRHKSGIAVRFPRIVRWRTDKKPKDADRLSDVLSLLS